MEGRDRLVELLSRYVIGGEPLTAAQALAVVRILELTRLSEADLTARGYRHLTVVHGEVERAEDKAALHQLASWADRHPGTVRRTIATNDTTTWLLAPPNAETNLAALEAVAQEHAPAWWRISRAVW